MNGKPGRPASETESPGSFRVSALGEGGEDPERMAEDVRRGLLGDPKDLSPWPKYFYDAEGSGIFEEITALPEYYQTRAELSILRERSGEILAQARCRELVELGSGSASKTRALLDAAFEANGPGTSDGAPVRYVPLDVSESAVRESGERLLREYPELEILGYVGDFEGSVKDLLGHLDAQPGGAGRLVVFLGGTIGNFTPERRREFLSDVRASMREEDHLLVGLDLVKDPAVLEAAYNDSAGVTARFNKNLLKVLNERLGGSFDPDLFRHRAIYDERAQRVEMWLFSERDQEIEVSDLGLSVPFEEGEGMRTEISAKFTPDSISDTFAESGLKLTELYTDGKDLFGLALGKRG
jgi:L-histidine Nalpha-methyltransferase